MRDEICKALVEPEIIPPLHSDQIAEPVMSQLMRNGVSKRKHSVD